MTDSHPRRPPDAAKKTALLELRVTPEEKAEFMAACRARGRSASDVLRTAMRRYRDAPRRNRRIVMTLSSLVPAAAAAFWMAASLTPSAPEAAAPEAGQTAAASGAQTAEASDGEIETAIVLTLVGGAVRGLESTYLLAEEPREIVIEDIAAEDLAPVFGPLSAETASLVMVLTATRQGPEAVTYNVTLNARDGDRLLLDEPLNPVLIVERGEEAKIEILNEYPGGQSKGLAMSLTPSS